MDEVLQQMIQEARGSPSRSHRRLKSASDERHDHKEAIAEAPLSENGTPAAHCSWLDGHTAAMWRFDLQPPAEVEIHAARQVTAQKPSLQQESLRFDAVQRICCSFLNKLTRSRDLDVRIPVFERWLLTTRALDGRGDPVLPEPYSYEPMTRAGQKLLRRELVEQGLNAAEALRFIKDLEKAARRVLRHTERDQASLLVNAPLPTIQVEHDTVKNIYRLRYKGTALSILGRHYEKLRQLHEMYSREVDKQQNRVFDGGRRRWCPKEKYSDTHAFEVDVLILLMRMHALTGGLDRGGGFQGSLNEDCFKVLQERLDCRFECFASPLNCRYRRYCSAFPDIDHVFGSVGSFFDFRPQEGCYEANPPFVPYLMMRMAFHMEDLLHKATQALCFVVTVPRWDKARTPQSAVYKAAGPSWNKLATSPFCVKNLTLCAREHGYIEGNQQRLPTRYKTSQFDTSIFFLQNEQAQQTWPITAELCHDLRIAFRSKHETETEVRRLAKAVVSVHQAGQEQTPKVAQYQGLHGSSGHDQDTGSLPRDRDARKRQMPGSRGARRKRKRARGEGRGNTVSSSSHGKTSLHRRS